MIDSLISIKNEDIFDDIFLKIKSLVKSNINIIVYGNKYKKLLVNKMLEQLYPNSVNTINENFKFTYNGKIYVDSLNYFENKSYVILNCRSLRTNSKIILLYLLNKYKTTFNITESLSLYKKVIVLYNFECISFQVQELFKSLEKYNIQIIITAKSISYILPQITSRFFHLKMSNIKSQHLDCIFSISKYEENLNSQLKLIFKFLDESCDITQMRNMFYNLLGNGICINKIITHVLYLLQNVFPDKVHIICELCAKYEHISCFTKKDIMILECLVYNMREVLK